MTRSDHGETTFELPFSYPVNVRTLPRKGRHLNYQAPAEVLPLIAKAYDLTEVASFSAECLVQPWKRDGVKISGTVVSSHTQPSAVSGDPIESSVDEPFEALFVPENSRLSRPAVNGEGEMVVSLDADDVPEVFAGDSIDLAQVWLEFFALALDPFARSDDEEFDTEAFRDPESSPFAALAALKKPAN